MTSLRTWTFAIAPYFYTDARDTMASFDWEPVSPKYRRGYTYIIRDAWQTDNIRGEGPGLAKLDIFRT